MKCKFAQFLFRAFGITGGALAVLFVIYYYNLDMKLMRSVVVPFLNKHYDSVKREHQIRQGRSKPWQSIIMSTPGR